MFISIPKEFFVPVIFGEGFILNEENNNLEIERNMYRESTGNKSNNENINISKNKEYLENSKSAKEKQDIVEIEMDNKKCGNEKNTVIAEKETSNKVQNSIIKPSVTSNKGDETINYIALKSDKETKNMCNDAEKIFAEIDNEFIDNIEIKGCSEK